MMVKIISIDVGIVNLGVASYDTTTKKVSVANLSLLTPDCNKKYKFTEGIVPFLVQKLILHHVDLFSSCDIIVIEQQMKRVMLIIQHVFMSFLLACSKTVRFIRPVDVRRFYNISCNNYAKNKRASIDLAPKLLTKTQLKDVNLSRFKKKDDVCEALILAFYASKNLSKIQTIELPEYKTPKKRRRTPPPRQRKSKKTKKTKK